MARPRKVQPETPVVSDAAPRLMIECLRESIGTNRGKLFRGGAGEIDPEEEEIMRVRESEGAVRFL